MRRTQVIALIPALIVCAGLAHAAEDATRAVVWPRDGAEMVRIASGSFEMGMSGEEAHAAWREDTARWEKSLKPAGWSAPRLEDYLSAAPKHRVALSAFLLDRCETTNAQFARYVAATGARPAEYADDPELGRPELPVVGVSWRDAMGYAEWAGKRLPTEAEWEYAARGPHAFAYPWGNTWEPSRANVAPEFDPLRKRSVDPLNKGVARPSGRAGGWPACTALPGSFPRGASPFGIMDLCGNAMEWVADAFDANYYRRSPAADPPGPATGEFRILRGGGWKYVRSPGIYRAVYRTPRYLGDRAPFVGFRCAANIDLHAR